MSTRCTANGSGSDFQEGLSQLKHSKNPQELGNDGGMQPKPDQNAWEQMTNGFSANLQVKTAL